MYRSGKHYLLAADETLKAKAGKCTHGIGRFYSSIAKQVIKSVSFLVVSIIDAVRRCDWKGNVLRFG